MLQTRYLLVGGSHAALEALEAIRMHDREGSVVLATRDPEPPCSPTVLPYVVSGRSDPARVRLRGERFFAERDAELRCGSTLRSLDTPNRVANFAGGDSLGYERLLLATGAAPAVPPIAGLESVPFHVLRTLADALRLRAALERAKHAVVLGAGLVGMHAAENLVSAGVQTTVLELRSQVLPGYFDAEAAGLIAQAFREEGARVLCGQSVRSVAQTGSGFALELEGGEKIAGDLLVVATGVRPAIGYLGGTGIAADEGILVDRRMRTSVASVWAAGDVAQAASFYRDARVVNGILPNAAEQGRVAGMDMAGDPGAREFRGAVPTNTFHFFGHQALSVGLGEIEGGERHALLDTDAGRYLKIVLAGDRLAGIFSIDRAFDPGIMVELVRRRVDLGAVKQQFLDDPRSASRALMSRLWR